MEQYKDYLVPQEWEELQDLNSVGRSWVRISSPGSIFSMKSLLRNTVFWLLYIFNKVLLLPKLQARFVADVDDNEELFLNIEKVIVTATSVSKYPA